MRDTFLLDPELVFLNHASFGACPRPVFDSYQCWQREMERNPVEFLGRRSAALLRQARERLGAFLGVPALDLAFVPNATTGVNIVARSLDLRPGDEVLGTDLEYGACDATWRELCARAGATYRRVPIALPLQARHFTAQVLAAVTPSTRLIFCSHIASGTALKLPIGPLCSAARERGIATLIDGAHAPGQIELDLAAIGADYYTGNCHKWLCAPKGSAFLHVRPERQQALEAAVISWGHLVGENTGVDTRALEAITGSSVLERRLQWQGTRDIAAFLSVPAAIDFQQDHDWPTRRAACHELAAGALHKALARNRLQAISGDEDFAQMVAIPVRCEAPEDLRRWLFERHRIEVPVTRHRAASFVRISVQAYNTAADLEVLDRALAEAGV